MIRRALALVFFAACKSQSSVAVNVADAAPSGAASVSKPSASGDAGKTIGPEERRAYSAAIKQGRSATLAKTWGDADAAFGRALAAMPDDARAYAERGYARHLAGRDESAKNDLLASTRFVDKNDKKLAAQIEFNLGLVETALGHAGVAAGHFRASNDLNPTHAAQAHMMGCPVTTSIRAITIYPSIADARTHYANDLRAQDDTPNAFVHEDSDGNAAVLVPIEGNKLAGANVGALGMWRCGQLGDVKIERVASAWKITYQAHRTASVEGICFCPDDQAACNQDGDVKDPTLPKCKCDPPTCPTVCGSADDAEGQHLEIYIDAKTGASIGQFEVDHEHMDGITLHADVSTKTLTATGGACAP